MTDYRKSLYRSRLNKNGLEWEDGDLSNPNSKSVDLINKSKGIAIELKLFTLSGDTNFSELPQEGKYSLTNFSNRFRSDARDANDKFKNYPEYKTILIIETDFPTSILVDVLEGVNLVTVSKSGTYATRKNKFLSHQFTEIGWYFIFSTLVGEKALDLKVIKNPSAKQERLLLDEKVLDILQEIFPCVQFSVYATTSTHYSV